MIASLWKRLIVSASIVALLFFVAFVSYLYGLRIHADKAAQNIDFVQGVLAFNHYRKYQEIADHINNKCYEQAYLIANNDKAKQFDLLSGYLQEVQKSSLDDYVRKRDPKLFEEAISHRSNRSERVISVAPCMPKE